MTTPTATINPRSREFRQEREELYATGQRRCNHCLETKGLEMFSRQELGVHGIHGRCNPCRSEYNSRWSREKVSEDMLYRRIERGRYRARKAGLPCEGFDAADLRAYWGSIGLSETECAYTGQVLTPETMTIEHVQPLSIEGSAGHVMSNCVPAHRSVNASRGTKHIVYFVSELHRPADDSSPEHQLATPPLAGAPTTDLEEKP